MALDHYVSQVHLKNFYDPILGERMHAIRKSDLETYACDSASQCRIEEGNTNPFLAEPRVVEEILEFVEPVYNAALTSMRERKFDADSVFAIAGFASYVAGSSPSGMRIHTDPIKSMVEATALQMDEMKQLPPPPEILGAESIAEMVERNIIKLEIDPKFAQSLAIQSMIERVSLWGNSRWDIIINDDPATPFFTSDFPVAIEPSKYDPRVINRIIPLAPDLAVRILPDIDLRKDMDLGFSNLRVSYPKLSRPDILALNTQIVRCAETTVFYRDDKPWVKPFVAKNRRYRIEPKTMKIPVGGGEMVWATMRVEQTGT